MVDINQVGAFLLGVTLGYILGHTVYGKADRTKWDAASFAAVVAAVAGTSAAILFNGDYVGYAWTGIAIGFFVYMAEHGVKRRIRR